MGSSLLEAVRVAGDGEGRLPCAGALALAQRMHATPLELGAAADEAGVKITQCRLGLFGWNRPPLSGPASCPAELLRYLESLPAPELDCAAACALAERYGVDLTEIGRAADALRVHICRCQLGCF